MVRRSFFLLALLLLIAFDQSSAQGVPVSTWSAKSSTGLTLMGTWTVVADTTRKTVTGTWTLVDAQLNTVTAGQWSASKAEKGWNGSWRAVVAGSTVDHVGTWSSGIDLKDDAALADLFEKAFQTFVTGNWRYSRYTGTWTLRGFK